MPPLSDALQDVDATRNLERWVKKCNKIKYTFSNFLGHFVVEIHLNGKIYKKNIASIMRV